MSARPATIVLLPGFDGTGELFKDFAASLPSELEPCILRYPADENHSYEELADYVKGILPASDPFFIAAESFSVPIAILCATRNPPNLKGLILCAGFARSPLNGLGRAILRLSGSLLFKIAPPSPMIRILLVGWGAEGLLVSRVKSAVLSVRPRVLAGRLNVVLNCDVRSDLENIWTPILYLRAKHDRIVRPSCGEEILRLNPRCTLNEINGPHLLLQRRPVESANAISQFIRDLQE